MVLRVRLIDKQSQISEKNIEDVYEKIPNTSVLVVANSILKNILNVKFAQKYFPNHGGTCIIC